MYTAIRRDGWASRALMTLSLVGVSLPTFLIGIGLIYLFADVCINLVVDLVYLLVDPRLRRA
nr:hypothetical protein [Xylophilus sp. ASV27]